MNPKKPSELQESGDKDIVLGHLAELKSDGDNGFLLTIIDDESEIIVRVPKKLAQQFEIGHLIICSGVYRRNKSGTRWLIADRIESIKDDSELNDDKIQSWQDHENKSLETKEKVQNVKLGLYKNAPVEKPTDSEKLDSAFDVLKENLKRKHRTH